MRNGVRIKTFAERIIISTMYFVALLGLLAVTGMSYDDMKRDANLHNTCQFVASAILTIVFLVIFISGWEGIRKSDGQK